MTKYAKLNKNGTLEYAPINLNGVSNWINDENAILAAGYLPLEELEPPEGQYVSGHKIFENKIVPIFASYPAPTYVDQRIAAYPDISDQLDMIYWDKINGTTDWLDLISEIKAKYPKPEVVDD